MWSLFVLLVSAQAMTVDEAVDAAVARSPVSDVADARVAEAEARVREARGHLLPTVTLTGGAVVQAQIDINMADKFPDNPLIDPTQFEPLEVQKQFALQAGAQLVQPLVVPQAWSAGKLAREGEALSRAEAESDRSRIARRAVEAWHAAAEARAVREDAQRAEDLAARLVEKGETLVSLGVAAPDDILPFRRALASARGNVAIAEEAVATTQSVLQVLTGLDSPPDMPAVPEAPPPLEAVLAELDRPDLRAAAQRSETVAQRTAVERGAYLPTVALVANATALTPVPDVAVPFNWHVGIQASIPLFQGGVVAAHVDQAAAQLSQSEAAARAQREGAEVEVTAAHGSLTRSLTALDEREEAVELARAAVTAAEKRLDEGAGSLLQLQQAQLEQVASEVQLTRARASAARAADLLSLALTGTL